jgi:hypothetical protein
LSQPARIGTDAAGVATDAVGIGTEAPTFAVEHEAAKHPAFQDAWTYRIITGGLSAAFILFIAGMIVVVALGKPIDAQLWSLGTALGGTLIGMLVPTSARSTAAAPRSPSGKGMGARARSAIATAARTASRHPVVATLSLAFVASLVVAAITNNHQVMAIATTTGGALLGYSAPSPLGRAEEGIS